jgi:hypothetical protein
VSVPFKDAAELDAGGTAAFLRMVPVPADDASPRRGAVLLQVNARGAPVEFTYNRLDLPSAALWRREQLDREATKALARSLFEAARRTPLVLLCLAGEIDAALFAEDLEVQIPVCRVAIEADGGPLQAVSVERVVSGNVTAHLFWRPALPSPESPPRRLVTVLAARGLLLEPFERGLAGFHEAFSGA